MNLRERIENNLTVWLLGSLFAGFMAGIGAYQAILEIAQLEVIPRAKLVEMQGSSPIDLSAESREGPPPANLPASQQFVPAQQTAQAFKLSNKLPFPEHLDSVKPGMRISEAHTVFPDGELTPNWYQVKLDSGPFSQVAFFVYGLGENPQIDVVNLQFRNEASKRAVFGVLLKELGERPHKAEMLGERLVWPNVEGYQLAVDETYQISLASLQDSKHE